MFKVATDKDYDDYNEYASYLASYLYDKLNDNGTYMRGDIYSWIQEFNKSLEEHG